MISMNSALFELEMEHRKREVERNAERRRLYGELVHAPGRSWKNVGQLRAIFGGDHRDQDRIA